MKRTWGLCLSNGKDMASSSAAAAKLNIEVMGEDERSIPCRMLVRLQDGNCVVPEGATELKIGPDRWFVSPGQSTLSVTGDGVEIRIERGLELHKAEPGFHFVHKEGSYHYRWE